MSPQALGRGQRHIIMTRALESRRVMAGRVVFFTVFFVFAKGALGLYTNMYVLHVFLQFYIHLLPL